MYGNSAFLALVLRPLILRKSFSARTFQCCISSNETSDVFSSIGGKKFWNINYYNIFLRLNRVEYHGISMHGICVSSNSNVSCLSPVTFDKWPTMDCALRSRKGLLNIRPTVFFFYMALLVGMSAARDFCVHHVYVELHATRPYSGMWCIGAQCISK